MVLRSRPRASLAPPIPRRRSLLFPEACGIFGNRCNPVLLLLLLLLLPLPTAPLYIMFLGGEPWYTCTRSVASLLPPSLPLSLSPSLFHRESPLCGRVYSIQAILILIKSAESIVCPWSFYRILPALGSVLSICGVTSYPGVYMYIYMYIMYIYICMYIYRPSGGGRLRRGCGFDGDGSRN